MSPAWKAGTWEGGPHRSMLPHIPTVEVSGVKWWPQWQTVGPQSDYISPLARKVLLHPRPGIPGSWMG